MKCLSRFAAVGWSDGGIVALLAAISYPGVITKVKRVGNSTLELPCQINCPMSN